MLKKLTIKNIALIDKAEIEFCEGLNVMSGETGAGKSVILDSINFALGAKADKSMIRYGESDCYVQAVFSVDENSECLERLKEMDIESDTDAIGAIVLLGSAKSTTVKLSPTSDRGSE